VKLRIRYQTAYSYDRAVSFSPHDVRLFPRHDRFSRVRRLDFKTDPATNVRFARDVFDNTVASCFFPEASAELQLHLVLDLEIDEKDPFHFILENSAVELPFAYDPEILDVLEPYRKRRTLDNLTVPGWTAPTVDKKRNTVATLADLNRLLHESLGYERREEGAARSPAETLRAGSGACRDIAVLLAELLREMGLAADRDSFVAVGDLGHHGTGEAGLSLRHQALQFGGAVGQILALRLELLAIIEIVFGGIGEGLAHAVAHIGAAGQRKSQRKQCECHGGARQSLKVGCANDHNALGDPERLRLAKAGALVRIEALLRRLERFGVLSKGAPFGQRILIPLGRNRRQLSDLPTKADVAELVDARNLRCLATPERSHLFWKT